MPVSRQAVDSPALGAVDVPAAPTGMTVARAPAPDPADLDLAAAEPTPVPDVASVPAGVPDAPTPTTTTTPTSGGGELSPEQAELLFTKLERRLRMTLLADRERKGSLGDWGYR